MADRLAATLGDRPAAMMKSHGAVTVGKSIVEAFVLANYLEENAYRQYMALQIGKPYAFTPEEVAACREKLWTESLFKRTWDHFRAKLLSLMQRDVVVRPVTGGDCHRSGEMLRSINERKSGVTSASISNHRFHAGRPWWRSMPRPFQVLFPRASPPRETASRAACR